MNANVTAPVIVDLWPLYASGEASAETRALVDEFLRRDPDLARQLHQDPVLPPAPLPPDHEAKALARTRRQLGGLRPLFFVAMLMTMMSFGRIVQDTSWDVSPRAFIATAAVAAACWIAYAVMLWRMRARILVIPYAKR